ncbi:AAA family ATPase [Halomonas urumqiensis]|uniref:Uncharacterized protein n=1 Tax=Halomonas urumqiensis TaxID=1684789 RepID=A0A2N7UK14_9GAMM|nr:bifunctional aminoglycoside phosphotransferase/ATP-binding protein [Halomonas urumqiensis]PMR80778.1 hypothetical protein C1H70_06835 [Halomonas urumqiensis]PTB02736.1 hypothetical protein C6V82_08835 [Halomonas urumqiensis]GHE21234.1 hypothetical protein GCM10017767_17550 [Halomonas urumqiensis]
MRHTREDVGSSADKALELPSLVDALVTFHRQTAIRATSSEDVYAAVDAQAAGEVAAIREHLFSEEDRQRLDHLEEWLEQDRLRLGALLESRQAYQVSSWALDHPESQLIHEGRSLLVNAIGHDPSAPGAELPSDPASDLAALLVGLESRGEVALARLALDRYLRLSGDYEVCRLLSLFATCHALTGARRALQRRPSADQDPEHPALLAECMAECRRFLVLAERIAEFRFPPLVIAVGVSGSGKSRFTSGLVARLGAIRVCSDVERRRLYGIEAESAYPQPVTSTQGVDIFSEEATRRTYRRLASCAGAMLDAGIPACVDGTFLTRWQRDLLRQQAEARGLPCLLVSFEADDATLKRRIDKRARRQGIQPQASLAVLEHQQKIFEAFGDEERLNLVHLDTTADNAAETLVGLIEEHVKLL